MTLDEKQAIDDLAEAVKGMIRDNMRSYRRRHLGYALALLFGGLLAGWNLAMAIALQ